MTYELCIPNKLTDEMYWETNTYQHRPHFERRWVHMKFIMSFHRTKGMRGYSYILIPASELFWNRTPLRKKK